MLNVFGVHRALDTFVHGAALVLNLTLANVILRNSNGTIKPYKWVLVLTCGNDILLSSAAILSQTVRVLKALRAKRAVEGPRST